MRPFFIVFMIMLLSACSLLAPIQPEHVTNYELTAQAEPGIVKSTQAVSILVNLPVGLGIHNSTEMAYSTQPYQIAYFAKNRWADTPARMLQPLMVSALQKTHYFSAISSSFSNGNYDYVLSTDIVQFHQVFFQSNSQFFFKLRAQMIETRTHEIVAEQTFSAVEQAPEYSPYGGVVAANRAVVKVLNHLADWCTHQKRGINRAPS